MKRNAELDSIAADLDSVLDRLGQYIQRQPNHPARLDDAPQDSKAIASPEILAAVLYRYAVGPPALRDAVVAAQAASNALERRRAALATQHDENKAKLLAALYACEMGERFSQPVPLEDCATLANTGGRFIARRDRYLGHDGHHRIMRNDGHLDKQGFEKRLAAAVVHTKIMEDPKSHPRTIEGVFHQVVVEGGFAFSAKTLANYYYEETAWPAATPQTKKSFPKDEED